MFLLSKSITALLSASVTVILCTQQCNQELVKSKTFSECC